MENQKIEITMEEYNLFVQLKANKLALQVTQKVSNRKCLDKFYTCTICNRELKYKSKHNHLKSKDHLKAIEDAEEASKIPCTSGEAMQGQNP